MTMKFNILPYSILSLVIITVICPEAQAQYRVVDVQGEVYVRRSGRTSPHPARHNMYLVDGDSLRIGQEGRARIRCPDLETYWDAEARNTHYGAGHGCPDEDGYSLRIGSQTDTAPGGTDPEIPYVLNPRRTSVLAEQPIILRWNLISGATRYTVRIIGNDLNWETEANSTGIQYSGPQLIPGVEYLLIIESDTGSSSQLDEGAETSRFELLYPEDAAIIKEAIATLDEQGLPSENYAIALADIYIRDDLYANAVNTLEPLVYAETEILEVYQTLGDIYRYIGLNLLAEQRYEKALELAITHEDIQAKAAVYSGLGEVKLILGQQNLAIELLSQARLEFESLNNTQRVEELKHRIDEIILHWSN